jgi:putative RecB family exonuclease
MADPQPTDHLDPATAGSAPASPEGPEALDPGPGPIDADGALRLLEVESAPPGTFGEMEPESPPLIDAQGRVRLSFSRIDAYQNCPRKFRYAYIDRLPGKPGPHLSFGTSIHSALEAFYDRKLPECPSVDDLLGFLYDTWDSTGFRDLPREEQVSFYRHAQDVLRRFHQRAAATYRLPADTEAWFELPVDYEAVVVGSIDRVDVDDDGRLHVIDYKTNRKVKNRQRVAGSLQLSIYALACRHLYGRLPATVCLDFVVPGVEVRVDVDDLDLDGAREAVLATAAAVRAERYDPTPNPLCDWCDFRSLCPAWGPSDDGRHLGDAVAETRRLRRQLRRDVRTLRELEDGVTRLAQEVRDADRDAQRLRGSADAPAAEAADPPAREAGGGSDGEA